MYQKEKVAVILLTIATVCLGAGKDKASINGAQRKVNGVGANGNTFVGAAPDPINGARGNYKNGAWQGKATAQNNVGNAGPMQGPQNKGGMGKLQNGTNRFSGVLAGKPNPSLVDADPSVNGNSHVLVSGFDQKSASYKRINNNIKQSSPGHYDIDSRLLTNNKLYQSSYDSALNKVDAKDPAAPDRNVFSAQNLNSNSNFNVNSNGHNIRLAAAPNVQTYDDILSGAKYKTETNDKGDVKDTVTTNFGVPVFRTAVVKSSMETQIKEPLSGFTIATIQAQQIQQGKCDNILYSVHDKEFAFVNDSYHISYPNTTQGGTSSYNFPDCMNMDLTMRIPADLRAAQLALQFFIDLPEIGRFDCGDAYTCTSAKTKRCFFKDVCKTLTNPGPQKQVPLNDFVLSQSHNQCINPTTGELKVTLQYCPPVDNKAAKGNPFIKLMCFNQQGDVHVRAQLYVQDRLNCDSAIIPKTNLVMVACQQSTLKYLVGFKEVQKFKDLCASSGAQLTGTLDRFSGGMATGETIGTCNSSGIIDSLGSLGNLFNKPSDAMVKYGCQNQPGAAQSAAPAPAPAANSNFNFNSFSSLIPG